MNLFKRRALNVFLNGHSKASAQPQEAPQAILGARGDADHAQMLSVALQRGLQDAWYGEAESTKSLPCQCLRCKARYHTYYQQAKAR